MVDLPSSPSASNLLNRVKGRSLTKVAKQGVGGWLLAVSTAFITGTNAVVQLLLFPVFSIIDIGDSVIDALILEPLTVVITGSEATAASVAQFELFGLPLGAAILLGTFAMVGFYLRRPSTSDFLPGTFWDSPFTGVDEEGEGGDA